MEFISVLVFSLILNLVTSERYRFTAVLELLWTVLYAAILITGSFHLQGGKFFYNICILNNIVKVYEKRGHFTQKLKLRYRLQK